MRKMYSVLLVLIAVAFSSNLVQAQAKADKKTPKEMYVEIGKMKTKGDVTDEQFLAIEKRIRGGIINQQPGFISREIGKDADGNWYFRICWDSKEHAEAWSPLFMKDVNGQAMMNALDFSTVRQEHYTVLQLEK